MKMAGEACLVRSELGGRTLRALEDSNLEAFVCQRHYAKRHKDKSAWDDGYRGAVRAADAFVHIRGVDVMTSVARGKADVRPLETWTLLAIEEDIELREKRWQASGGARSPEYRWYLFLTTTDELARKTYRETLPSAQAKLGFDVLERDALSYRSRLLAFQDPSGDGIRKRLAMASCLESSGSPDPTDGELGDIGHSLAYRESLARMGRQIEDARRQGRGGARPGRSRGSGDPVRHAFYLGVISELLTQGRKAPSARDVAEISIVRRYATSTDVKRETESWKKWIADHSDDWEIAWVRAHVDELRTGELNLDGR